MLNIKFYCRSCKARTGEAPIEVAITLNGERKFFTTSLKCDVNSFKSKPPKYVAQYLDSLKLNLSQTVADLTAKGIPLSADLLRTIVRKGGVMSYTLQDLYNDFNKLLKLRVKAKSITPKSAYRYNFIQQEFSKHIPLTAEVSSITPASIQLFYTYLLGKYQESTAANFMTRLKSIIIYARDNNHLSINPFQGLKIKKHQKDITYLTEEEINKIANLQIENKSLANVRDLFILQASTGLAYTDVANLKKEDIKIAEDGTHYIIKNRQKTNVQFTTIVLPWGVEVLKRHNYQLRVISNQKVNSILKTIQTLAGITTNMTTHLARRTFATYLLCNKRVRVEVVSKALGHTNVKQTLSAYAKLIDTQVIDELKAAL